MVSMRSGRPICSRRNKKQEEEEDEGEIVAPRSLRFLVTRDPFARLWSAYVDKFLLPDFWGHFGLSVVRRFRKAPTELAKR